MSLLLAIAQATEFVADIVRRSGGTSAKRGRVILVERVNEFVDEFAEAVKQEPKIKAKLRQAKKIKPAVVEETIDNAKLWAEYYYSLIAAIQDRKRAEDLRNSINRSMVMLLKLIEAKRIRNEEDALIAILLTI
jgi:hypothetical protein